MSEIPEVAGLPKPRQARSIATRLKLLDAAMSCLVDRGYVGTSTSEVSERAGLSQGALFKHFPTKTQLLVEAVAHLFRNLVDEYRRDFAQLAADAAEPTSESAQDLVGAALQLLERSFRDPRLLAAFELYAVARTDREMRAAMEPVMRAHRDAIRDEAQGLFPDAAKSNPEFGAFIDVVIAAMQGRALGALAAPDPSGDAREFITLYRLARRELQQGSRSQGGASEDGEGDATWRR